MSELIMNITKQAPEDETSTIYAFLSEVCWEKKYIDHESEKEYVRFFSGDL